jgi:general secretion pathway protein D
VLAGVRPAAAQDNLPPAVYKVEFRIRDGSDAAARNGRRYTMLLDDGFKGTLKIGERVPVATTSFQPGIGGGVNPLVNTQYTYIDVGVNIDATLRKQQDKILLQSDLDISTLVERKPQPGSAVLPQPTVAQMKTAVHALIVPGKATLVASIDDPVTQRKFDVEALVTKE